MRDPYQKMTWRGRGLDELSREELIEAVWQVHDMYESECKTHDTTRGMFGAYRDALA